MAKIGRNDPCPCGSGLKYKRCCLGKQESGTIPTPNKKITVSGEAEIIRQAAINHQETLKIIGVFIFFSTAAGDAWILELTEQDAAMVARNGKAVDVEISEQAETISINWSHRFKIKNRKFITTAYQDKSSETYDNYPAATINSTLKKIQRRFSSELLESIHVNDKDTQETISPA
ncbi:YecA family protein [Desulfobacterota bacterium M19]